MLSAMTSTYHGRGWVLEVEQPTEVVRSGVWTRDPDWRGVDENGHEHYYEHGYPTLDFIVDESHWCDGSEGISHHDPHEQIDESHYECLICRAVVEPGSLPPDHPITIRGPINATLAGNDRPGSHRRVWLTEDEFERIRAMAATGEDDGTALDILRNAPPDRIIEQRYSSG